MRRPRTIDGQIIAIADDAAQIGQYQVVVLNRGANARPRRRARCSRSTSRAKSCTTSTANDPWNKKPFGDEVQLPYERAGTLIVFKVFDRISYGLVIGARAPMQVADRVYNP